METFEEARATGTAGVVLAIQANPAFDSPDTFAVDERAPDVEDGFAAFHRVLREQVLAFERPVLLVHGDSHYFRVDKPMEDDQGRRVERFTRLETFGEADPHWVRLTAAGATDLCGRRAAPLGSRRPVPTRRRACRPGCP